MDISERIRQVFDNKRTSFKNFCDISDVKYRTLQTYLDGRMPSSEFLIEFNRIWNVSSDWILTGKGQMYLHNESKTNYSINKPNSDNSRAQRLNMFIIDWLETHNEDEQAWFEVDFKNHYQDYKSWLTKIN